MMIVVLVGCSESKGNPFEHTAKIPEPATKPVELSAYKTKALEKLSKITELRDEMCKCRDRACAGKLLDGFQAWDDAHPNRATPGPGEEDEMTRKMIDVATEQKECFDKIYAATSKLSPYLKKGVEALAKLSMTRDEMCKCPAGDQACGMRVQENMLANAESNDLKPEPGDKAKLEKEMAPLLAEIKKCWRTSMMPAK